MKTLSLALALILFGASLSAQAPLLTVGTPPIVTVLPDGNVRTSGPPPRVRREFWAALGKPVCGHKPTDEALLVKGSNWSARITFDGKVATTGTIPPSGVRWWNLAAGELVREVAACGK